MVCFETFKYENKKYFIIGTNNAAIPLILLILISITIIGIELQKEVMKLAEENVLINCKTEKVKIIYDDINDYVKYNVNFKYNLIICNPFFKVDVTKLNEKNKLLILAWHETNVILLEKIIFADKKLIENRGVVRKKV